MQEKNQPTPAVRRHRPILKTPLFWIIVVIFTTIGIFLALHFLKQPESATSKPQSSVAVKTTSPATEKKETTEPASNTDQPSDSDGKTPEKFDGPDPNQGESLTGYLTAARFDGEKLVLRVNIDQYLPGGTCSLEISDGTRSLQKTANISPVASTSSCEGFDVPTSELKGFSRPLNIKIALTSGAKSGTIEGNVE
ncbi:hypothetical protein IKE71_01265 [Candidatus Saccharibacteria bacterium]|nr:hypothetical protein [Candidatus Saccharibacteria bacterium]